MKNELLKKIPLVVLAFVVLMAIVGCKTKSGPVSPPPAETAKIAEQTVCPVMVMSIDKSIYTEYKGTKVYFCCPACKPEFEKGPEKYIDKLPQFKNVEKDKIWQALGSEKYISANFRSLQKNRKSMV